MITTYMEQQLDMMCLSRPPGYKEEILAISVPKAGHPGMYEMDTESDAYRALKVKYSDLREKARKETLLANGVSAEGSRLPSGGRTVLRPSDVEAKAGELAVMFGPESGFSKEWERFKSEVQSGRCVGCRRSGAVRRLYGAFAVSLKQADRETRLKTREMFPETECADAGGRYVKWTEILDPAG